MITGRVENRHALLPVTFSLSGRPSISIEFVVDTGFTDAQCLPAPAVVVLGLPFQFDIPAASPTEVRLSFPFTRRQFYGTVQNRKFMF
jgi:predicted aspartyl protease